jgi:hypothetical protein
MWWLAVPVVAIGCTAALILAAYSTAPGPLRADRRVSILEPAPGSTVPEPVQLRWRSRFDPGPASGRWFAVFLDAAPVPPGRSMLTGPVGCDTVAACIERGAFAGPNVFLTDRTEVHPGPLRPGAGGQHRFTIVLVDEHGVRDGAVAWNATFRTSPPP